MEKLKFYNLAQRKPVTTDKYKIVNRHGHKLAVATMGKTKMYRVLPKK
jgi:hypothetical protein